MTMDFEAAVWKAAGSVFFHCPTPSLWVSLDSSSMAKNIKCWIKKGLHGSQKHPFLSPKADASYLPAEHIQQTFHQLADQAVTPELRKVGD